MPGCECPKNEASTHAGPCALPHFSLWSSHGQRTREDTACGIKTATLVLFEKYDTPSYTNGHIGQFADILLHVHSTYNTRQDDLLRFQAAHFPGASISDTPFDGRHNAFRSEGTELGETEEVYNEDDGLGYYGDGVKRNLTDEQVEIFRHSEIHTLLRERERLREEEKEEAAAGEEAVDTTSDLEKLQGRRPHKKSNNSNMHNVSASDASTLERKSAERSELDDVNVAVQRPKNHDAAANMERSQQNSSPQTYSGVRRIVSYADD